MGTDGSIPATPAANDNKQNKDDKNPEKWTNQNVKDGGYEKKSENTDNIKEQYSEQNVHGDQLRSTTLNTSYDDGLKFVKQAIWAQKLVTPN